MILWILLLLLILVVFGFGFILQILWWVAAVLLVLWIAGFAMRGRRGGRRDDQAPEPRNSRAGSPNASSGPPGTSDCSGKAGPTRYVRSAPFVVMSTMGWFTLTCNRPEGRLRRVCAGVVCSLLALQPGDVRPAVETGRQIGMAL